MTVFLCRTWWGKRLRQSFMEVNIVLSNPSLWRRWAVSEWQSIIKITIRPLALGFIIHKHTGRLLILEACGHVCGYLPCPNFKRIKSLHLLFYSFATVFFTIPIHKKRMQNPVPQCKAVHLSFPALQINSKYQLCFYIFLTF